MEEKNGNEAVHNKKNGPCDMRKDDSTLRVKRVSGAT